MKKIKINESKLSLLIEGDKNRIVGLWLDDLRHDPLKFLNKKDDQSKSGAVVRDWYNKNMSNTDIQWTAVSNFWEFVDYIRKNGVPDFVSLDHDLGKDPATKARKVSGGYMPSGADCALYLVSFCLRNGIGIPKNYIHSANDNSRVFISKAFRLGRMGKDPMEGVDIDNEDEFSKAAMNFKRGIKNPDISKNLKKAKDDSQFGTADRLARIKGLKATDDLFGDGKFGKESFRESRYITN